MRVLPLRNITGVVRSTDLILADNHSCVAILLRPGQVQLGWPLPLSPLWNEPIPTLSPHTHILNQVVDITLSWAPHHSFFFPLLRQGAALAGWGYRWCLQWGFPYLLTSPRPHTPTWSRLLWTPYPGRAKWASTDHHQTSGGKRTTPTTEILYTDITTQGPPASTVSAQLATVSSQQCATCPSPIAKHITGPSSGTRCGKETSLNGWSVQSTDLLRAANLLADNHSPLVAISLQPGQVQLLSPPAHFGMDLIPSPYLPSTLSPHTHVLNTTRISPFPDIIHH